MRRLKVLIVLFVLILTACTTTTGRIKPIRPHLEIIMFQDGGICLDRENTLKLFQYILELEKGYEE